MIVVDGERKTLSQLAEETGWHPETLRGRIFEQGLSVDQALNRPRGRGRKPPRYIEHNGERLTLAGWAARIGLTPEGLAQRLRAWGDVGRALSQPARGSKDREPLTCRGITRPIAEWAAEIGLTVEAIRGRLASGLAPEEALSLRPGEVHPRRIWIEYGGERLTLSGWAARLGINSSSMAERWKKCNGDIADLLRPAGVRRIKPRNST